MISMNLGWKSEELEAFFNNYTNVHTNEVIKGLCELESRTVLASEKVMEEGKEEMKKEEEEDIHIQINVFEEGKDETKEAPKSSEKEEIVEKKE
jgi:hypothetical protein